MGIKNLTLNLPINKLDPNLSESENNAYDYLLKMPIYNLTKEKIDDFNDQMNNNTSKYDSLKGKNTFTLWNDDLKDLGIVSNKKKKLIINKN